MARIRTIKPEFWTAEQIMECSPNARLLFIGMWNFCDDAGIHPASCKTLKAEVFPSDDITASEIGTLVAELEGQGLIEEPPTPPTAREGEFPMDLSWEPSDHFPTLARQAGAPSPTAEAVAEFRSYWIGQGAAMSQHQWDHKLLTNLKAQKLRGGHAPPGRANARASPGQPRTLSEGRAAAAKAIFNPGPAGQDDGHERRTIDVTPAPQAELGAKALR
jgi:hypothetical protein